MHVISRLIVLLLPSYGTVDCFQLQTSSPYVCALYGYVNYHPFRRALTGFAVNKVMFCMYTYASMVEIMPVLYKSAMTCLNQSGVGPCWLFITCEKAEGSLVNLFTNV